jgi:hypothetical protein
MVGVAMIGDRRLVTTTGMRRIGTRTVGSEHILRKNGTSTVCPLCARMHRYTTTSHKFSIFTRLSAYFHAKGRVPPDIQTPIAFLTIRVQSPDTDDWKKLGRVMKRLNSLRELVLALKADDTQILKLWIDGSFATHHDMRSHTGGMLSMGKGVTCGTSIKQKLNARSSTETELVGTNDVLPQVLWTRCFLDAQGYNAKEYVIHQDNLNAMLMEKNGKGSSSKRTRHVNICYFFIKDRIASKEFSIEHCPTGEMPADFFTKSLQGSAFCKFRDQVMNIQ